MSRYRFRSRAWKDEQGPTPGLTIGTPYGIVHVEADFLRRLADAAHDAADHYEQQHEHGGEK